MLSFDERSWKQKQNTQISKLEPYLEQENFCYVKLMILNTKFSSVQSLSHVWLFETPWTAAHEASLSITSSQNLLKLMSIESVMPSNHLTLCCPLLLPPVFPSIRVFSIESVLCIRWPKYCSFSFNINLSNEQPGLISLRMNWLDLLAVQGTLKSLLQHYSSQPRDCHIEWRQTEKDEYHRVSLICGI